MENSDMFNVATRQQTFHDFLERMKHPSAADLVKSVKSFIHDLLASPLDPKQDSARVQEFLSTTEIAFKAHPLWANATEEELESAGEGLEKYIMTKIFSRVYSPVPSDAARDAQLSDKISGLQRFIKPEHLDLTPSFHNEASWLLAQKELQKINTYKAPRDKLVCILNCCRVINNLLLNISIARSDRPPGADDFLPALIFVVIKANPFQLHSNLEYIQRYRHASRLVSEAAYFYTNMASAEAFIANLDAQSLSMDESQYRQYMEGGTGVERARLEAGGASGVVEADTSGQLLREFPFLYANAGDLRVEDVELLLKEHKELVLSHVALCRGLENSGRANPAPSPKEAEASADMTLLLENLHLSSTGKEAAPVALGESEEQWENVGNQQE